MVDTTGLSLDQAPPIHLPLRFFLTASGFAVAAGLILAIQGESALATRWSPAALAVTHLIALGFLSQVLCGALIQLLPVVIGVPLSAVELIAPGVHLSLSLGTASLAAGFLNGAGSLLAAGAAFSGLGLVAFLAGLIPALARARGGAATLVSLRLAALALALNLAFGLALTAVLLGWLGLPGFANWVGAHLALGLLGWVGLPIVGIAYQLVPLFHVTPAYPRWMTLGLTPVLSVALAATVLFLARGLNDRADQAVGVIAVGYAAFAGQTLVLQWRRARPRVDATLVHWWLAMVAIVLAGIVWWLEAPVGLLGVLLLIGVGIGLPSGMLLKIVPFLCWFHLQSRWMASARPDLRIPHMHRLLPDRLARWHPALHALALGLLCAGSWEPVLTRAGGLVLCASALWLFGLIAGALWRYRRVARLLAEG